MTFLRSNTAVIVAVGPFYDKTDGVTIETALTITNERITLVAETDAGSAPTLILDNITGATAATANDLNYITGGDNGMMQIELAAADVNRVGRMKLSITDAANHVPVFHEFFVLPAAIFDWLTGVIVPLPANVTTWLGTAAATPTVAGVPEVDVTHWIGTAAATPTVAGVPEVDLTHVAGATTNVAALATNVDAILTDTGTTLDGRIPAALVSGRMDSSVGAYAAGQVPARISASGTADSGSTTTVVDTERTEAGTDYWRNCIIRFTSGTLAGQTALVTAFNPATDTLTFTPALTTAVVAHTYELLAMSRVDVAQLLGDAQSATDLKDFADAGYDPATDKVQGVGLVDTLTTYTGNTVQTGDSFARLGAPAGASVSADLVVIDNFVDGLETTIGAAGAGLTAVPWNAAWDAEAQSEVNDALVAFFTSAAALVDLVWDEALAELAQAAPSATPAMRAAVAALYMALRNAVTVTSTTKTFSNDAGTVVFKKALTDDGTTYTEAETVTGP
jgi:hypothetical protein